MATQGDGPRYSVARERAAAPRPNDGRLTVSQRLVSVFAVLLSIAGLGVVIYLLGRVIALLIGFFGGWVVAE